MQASSNKSVPIKVLFIGNSATHKNDIPKTLCSLAQKAGYSIEQDSITKDGAKLTLYADAFTEYGQKVRKALQSGYDIAAAIQRRRADLPTFA